MELTEYDKKTFRNIEKLCVPDKWYVINREREDFTELYQSLKKFNECYGLLKFEEYQDKIRYMVVLREKNSGYKFSELESKIYHSLTEVCKPRKWYPIDKSREDYKDIINALLNINDKFGGVELNVEETHYRRVESLSELQGLFSTDENQNRDTLDNAQSIKKQKTSVCAKKEKEVLKKDLNRHPNWSIPMFNSRPDIGDRIMAEYNSKSESKRIEEEQQKEKLKKIQEWKKN